MTTAYTSLLGLALPVTGELSGTWGDTVNNYITQYLDAAVAGTITLSSDSDVTLTKTTNTSLSGTSSQYAVILWTAGGTATRTIIAPSGSSGSRQFYIVVNKTSSTQSIKLCGTGPTTGVTITAGTAAICAWNGSDFIQVAGNGVVPIASGGTALSATPTNGQLPIGNGTGYSLGTLTAGSNITITNGAGAITIAAAGGSTGTAATTFTSSGTFTIPTGVTKIKMTIVGGGATGSGSTQGGGGGGAAIKYLTGLTPGNTLTVTVGSAGNTSSVASGTQSITTVSATGGSSSGSGGLGSNGDLNIKGGAGAYRVTSNGGIGGSSIFGGGGQGGGGAGTNGNGGAGGAYGGGGGSGGSGTLCCGPNNPGTGASGVVLIEYVS